LGGEPYLNKPPLYHGAVAFDFFVLGETPFAARLPSAVCALLLILLTASFATKLAGDTAGWIAGALLLLSIRFFTESRSSEMETMLTFGVTLSIWGFLVTDSSRMRLFAMGIGTGVATLTKGPVLALLFPSLFVLVQILQCKSLNPIKRRALLMLPIAALLATAGYYGPMLLDAEMKPLLLERAAMANVEHVRGPFYYAPQIVVGMLPALLLVVPFVGNFTTAWRTSASIHLIFGVVGVLLLSLSKSKQSHYLLPFYPHFAVFFGVMIASARERASRIPLPSSIIIALLGIAALIASAASLIPQTLPIIALSSALVIAGAFSVGHRA
jgi:4-amino-4-deoxy-L-arabinose transferase-like glycosyltransferase